MKSKVIIFVSQLFFAYYANSAPKMPIYEGQLLSEAKAKLVAKGWKPYRVMGDKTPPNEISGMAKNYMNAGYVEVGNCGDSNPDCDFNYRKKICV